MITVGIQGMSEVVVTQDNTAKSMGSGTLEVFATPAMIALMEKTASESVSSKLIEGESTVGVSVTVKHISATPIGCKIRCESKLVEIDRKKLIFEVEAYDEHGLIGSGMHERFLIDVNKFMNKANEKQMKKEECK